MFNFKMYRKIKRNKKSDKSKKTYQKYGKFSNKNIRIKVKNISKRGKCTF